tara:strand:- start:8 stop:652 length:645 start_codon:yes stop_codon:yes gene_type:complete
MNNLNKTMDAINELNKTHGVKQRGGKMYTQVVHRMEAFRRHHGTEYGVDTQILVDDGQRVVIKAIITNNDGHTVGSGMAEEIRGQGHVNTTSALENAETSAVGRALASLGLAGGEYASANEMDAVGRKSDAIESNKAEPVAVKKKPLSKEEAEWLAHNEATLDQYTLDDLDKFMNNNHTKATMKSIKDKDVGAYNEFRTLCVEKRNELKEQANG